MLKTSALLILATCAPAAEWGADLLFFGASYHTDRSYDWKEVNLGFGVAPHWKLTGNLDAFVALACYNSSVDKPTDILVPGLRWTQRIDNWHYGVEAGAGYMNTGYAVKFRQFGSVFGGYDRFSLHATYIPNVPGNDIYPSTAAFAAWVRIHAFTF